MIMAGPRNRRPGAEDPLTAASARFPDRSSMIYWFRISCFVTKSGQDARAPGKERTRNETFYP